MCDMKSIGSIGSIVYGFTLRSAWAYQRNPELWLFWKKVKGESIYVELWNNETYPRRFLSAKHHFRYYQFEHMFYDFPNIPWNNLGNSLTCSETALFLG